MKEYKNFWIVLALIIIIPLFDSCKKGEQDPFFSIYPRKARVVADWDITELDRYYIRTLDDGQQAVINLKITGGTKLERKIDSVGTAHDTSRTVTGEVIEGYYHFDKDGKMEHTLHYKLVHDSIVVDDQGTGITYSMRTTTTRRIIAKGTWNFLGRVDDYKNKERITLVYETYNEDLTVNELYTETDDNGVVITTNLTTTRRNIENKYANGESAEVWELNMLKNKEILMYRDIDRLINDQWDTTGVKYTEQGYENIRLTRE